MKGKLNDWYKTISPNLLVEGKFIGRHTYTERQWQGQVKMLGTKITGDTEDQGHYNKRFLA